MPETIPTASENQTNEQNPRECRAAETCGCGNQHRHGRGSSQSACTGITGNSLPGSEMPAVAKPATARVAIITAAARGSSTGDTGAPCIPLLPVPGKDTAAAG